LITPLSTIAAIVAGAERESTVPPRAAAIHSLLLLAVNRWLSFKAPPQYLLMFGRAATLH
jgi:hypothetical protein